MSHVRVALANLKVPLSREESIELAIRAIHEAQDTKADVICFPECFIPGYRSPDKHIPSPDQKFLDYAWSSVAKAAAASDVAVILGTERIVDRAHRITALVIDRDGSILGFQDKIQLDPSEDQAFAPGTERHIFQSGDLTFGVVICHEGWRYPETVRWAVRRGAQIVFHPHFHEIESGFPPPSEFADPRNTFHEKAILCRAAENTCYFASVNCAGVGLPTTSAIAKPDGTLLTYQPYGQEGLLIADVDLTLATGLLAARCKYESAAG